MSKENWATFGMALVCIVVVPLIMMYTISLYDSRPDRFEPPPLPACTCECEYCQERAKP